MAYFYRRKILTKLLIKCNKPPLIIRAIPLFDISKFVLVKLIHFFIKYKYMTNIFNLNNNTFISGPLIFLFCWVLIYNDTVIIIFIVILPVFTGGGRPQKPTWSIFILVNLFILAQL